MLTQSTNSHQNIIAAHNYRGKVAPVFNEIKNLAVDFNDIKVLKDVNLSIN